MEVPEEVPEGLGAEAGQVQRCSGKGCREGSREGSGRSWPGPTRFRKVPEKVLEDVGAKPGQVQRAFGEGSGLGSMRVQVGFGAIPGVCRRSF